MNPSDRQPKPIVDKPIDYADWWDRPGLMYEDDPGIVVIHQEDPRPGEQARIIELDGSTTLSRDDAQIARELASARRTKIKEMEEAGDLERAARASLRLLAHVQLINAHDPATMGGRGGGHETPAPDIEYCQDAADLLRKTERYADEVKILDDLLANPGATPSHRTWAERRLPQARELLGES